MFPKHNFLFNDRNSARKYDQSVNHWTSFERFSDLTKVVNNLNYLFASFLKAYTTFLNKNK